MVRVVVAAIAVTVFLAPAIAVQGATTASAAPRHLRKVQSKVEVALHPTMRRHQEARDQRVMKGKGGDLCGSEGGWGNSLAVWQSMSMWSDLWRRGCITGFPTSTLATRLADPFLSN